MNLITGPKRMTDVKKEDRDLGALWKIKNTVINDIYSSCLFYQLLGSQKPTLSQTDLLIVR